MCVDQFTLKQFSTRLLKSTGCRTLLNVPPRYDLVMVLCDLVVLTCGDCL